MACSQESKDEKLTFFSVFSVHFSKDININEKFKLTESTDKKNLFAEKCKLVMWWGTHNQCPLSDHTVLCKSNAKVIFP